MSHFVGLDAGKNRTSICVLDDGGRLVSEGDVETNPRAIIAYLRGDYRRYRRIGIESISFAPWIYEAVAKAGLPIVCIEARHAHGVLKARRNKTDRNDARGIAEIMHAGLYKAVHIKTAWSQDARMLLAARRHLRIKIGDNDNFVRSQLLQKGLKLRPGQPYSFDKRAEALTPPGSALAAVVDPFLAVRRLMDDQVRRLDIAIADLVRSDPVCRLLTTAPGVGPLIALSYRTAIDVPQRFARSRDVGVHLGLTPRAFNSGTVVRMGRISKCGDETARAYLFLAAQSVLRPYSRMTGLKAWGLQVAASRGGLKARVAVARRLAVILHRMWLSEADFQHHDLPMPSTVQPWI